MVNPTDQRVEQMSVGAGRVPESFEAKYLRQRDWKSWEVASFYFGGVGTGLYALSLFLDDVVGLIVGFLLVMVAKNVSHLIASTHPLKGLRSMSKPGSSWISRGALFIFLFGVFGLLNIIVRLGWIPGDGGALDWVLSALALAAGLVVMIYIGFVMAAARTIPLWNSPLLPVIFIPLSLAMGAGLANVIFILAGRSYDSELVRTVLYITLPAAALLIVVHLMVLNYRSVAAKLSLQLLTRGRYAATFILGVLVAGLILPLVLTAIVFGTGGGAGVATAISGLLILLGGFLFERCLFAAAVYSPVVEPAGEALAY